MKQWEIVATVVGAVVLLGGVVGTLFAVSKNGVFKKQSLKRKSGGTSLCETLS